jgi:hypothetical protein
MKRALQAIGIVILVAVSGAAAVGLYLFISIARMALHGDDENQMTAAAASLSCPPSAVTITGTRATGCGRACVLETTGSSATWASSWLCSPEDAGAADR